MDKRIAIPAGLAIMVALAVIGVMSIIGFTATNTAEASITNISQDLQGNADLGKLTEPFASPLAATALITGTTTFVAAPNKPGSDSSYTITFRPLVALTAGTDKIILDFDKDFQLPATLDRTQITISSATVTNASSNTGLSDTVNPQTVVIELIGTENNEPQVTLTVPDMVVGDAENISAGAQSIEAGTKVTIIFQQGAGIKNPTEGGGFDFFVSTNNETTRVAPATAFTVPRIVEMSAADGPRGENLTLVALGFKNSTTVTFWRDANGDGVRDTLEIDLCNAVATSADIATCDYSVSNPPFAPRTSTSAGNCTLAGGIVGCNYINAVDGRNNKVNATAAALTQAMLDRQTFDLRGSVTASPSTGNPGDTITYQLKDFPASETVTTNTLGGVAMTTVPATVTTDAQGEINFTAKIPNDVAPGVQSVAIASATSGTRRTNMTIGAADLLVTPTSVVPNQRVSIIGTGFTDGGSATVSTITIGGETVHTSKINDGTTITIDAGGSWSASIEIPVTSATTVEGPRELKVSDSGGRDGTTSLNFPKREITINPAEGRVSTNVTVAGKGFPAKNNDGESITVSVTYDAGSGGGTNSSTATPDTSGSWQVTLQVPSGASIPSTNTVKATFDLFDANSAAGATSATDGITTVTHRVPRAVISVDTLSGPPGTAVNIEAIGFKRFTPVTTLKVGTIDVTPSPKPATNANGGASFEFLIPGTDTGVQTIELNVGGTTASVGFTVTDSSGVGDGVMTPIADALAPLFEDETLDRVFFFNNVTKEWQFHITEDAFSGANNLEDVASGQPIWIKVTESKTVELNAKNFDLTCVNAGTPEEDCWNLIVFP